MEKIISIIKKEENNDIIILKQIPQNFVLVLETYFSDNIINSINFIDGIDGLNELFIRFHTIDIHDVGDASAVDSCRGGTIIDRGGVGVDDVGEEILIPSCDIECRKR